MPQSLPPGPTAGQPTQHAMLIAWGHCAQSLALLPQLSHVPIPQKTVAPTPAAKLLTLLLGLLSGIEYLSDLSTGAAPLCKDVAVAHAWGLARLADATSVRRTLAACNTQVLQILQTVLDELSQPFLDRAVADLHARRVPLLLDVDLTGRSVSDTSQTYPGAAFGYMDAAIHRGYPVAAICLQTTRYGRQWLSGRQHPGNTVSAPCLRDLITQAERRPGCHPRRRTELLDARISLALQSVTTTEQVLAHCHSESQRLQTRKEQLRVELNSARCRVMALQDRTAVSAAAPYGPLPQAERHLRGCQRRWHRVEQQQRQLLQQERGAMGRLPALRTTLAQLQTRRATLATENAQQEPAPCCRVRMDAGFCSGENVTLLLELGYEIETKVGHGAVLGALLQRVTPTTVWTRVGKNAEMIGWANYQLDSCPYPVSVALERFHTAQGPKYSVLLHSQELGQQACPDLVQWFTAYNGRQTIESGIKQTKTVFKLQHLMSRHAVGMQIQVALTLFAANLVRWAEAWVQERVVGASTGAARRLQRPKYLVRIAANSPAIVEQTGEQVQVRFSPLSGLEGVVLDLGAPAVVQLPLLFLPCSRLIDRQ